MGFVKDRYRGRVAEQFVKNILVESGFTLFPTNTKSHDILFHLGRSLSAEVKFDIYAAKSGRVAFEIANPKTGNPSGIYKSTADLLFYVFSDTTENPIPTSAYVCSMSTIQWFLLNHKPIKTIQKAGDGNATVWLYDKHTILEMFDEITHLERGDVWTTLDLILQLASP